MALKKQKSEYLYLHQMYKISSSVVDSIHNDTQLIDLLKFKFKTVYAKHFIEFTGLPIDIWSKILPISKRTLQRKLSETKNKLTLEVSEPMVEIGEIYRNGLIAFDGNKERFNHWLNSKNPYFDERQPLHLMDSHKGRELIKDELIRIEYGAFA